MLIRKIMILGLLGCSMLAVAEDDSSLLANNEAFPSQEQFAAENEKNFDLIESFMERYELEKQGYKVEPYDCSCQEKKYQDFKKDVENSANGINQSASRVLQQKNKQVRK